MKYLFVFWSGWVACALSFVLHPPASAELRFAVAGIFLVAFGIGGLFAEFCLKDTTDE